MNPITDLHSPKQIAQALGVSESSLKRWCDDGLIQTTRTGGGHRKVATADVIRFARDRGMKLVTPELLGLPPLGSVNEADLRESARLLTKALVAGDFPLSRQIVLNLALVEHTLARVFDDVIAAAFVEIGDLWACHRADIYQERRGCEMIFRILAEIAKTQSPAQGALAAIGGTVAGNPYALQTLMAEIVLRDCDFQATSLGTGIPFDSFAQAVREIRPTLFWLSVAFVADEAEFLHGFSQLSTACAETQTAIVIGGRALTPFLREQMVDTTYCENMQQLSGFARTLARIHQRSVADKSPSPKL
jgi:MerR family transcriptional regulator, light-induced transcriptional regulator